MKTVGVKALVRKVLDTLHPLTRNTLLMTCCSPSKPNRFGDVATTRCVTLSGKR
jgi:hypothetical protein